MEKLSITICKGDESYGAWIENLPGVYGEGETVEDAKDSISKGLELYTKHNKQLPAILQHEYELEYRLDIPSFLDYYSKVFSKPALEKMTGINQKQFFHYASGRSKPSMKTVKKIDEAFRHFAGEMNQMHLYSQ